jgi:hypothetical protein
MHVIHVFLMEECSRTRKHAAHVSHDMDYGHWTRVIFIASWNTSSMTYATGVNLS